MEIRRICLSVLSMPRNLKKSHWTSAIGAPPKFVKTYDELLEEFVKYGWVNVDQIEGVEDLRDQLKQFDPKDSLKQPLINELFLTERIQTRITDFLTKTQLRRDIHARHEDSKKTTAIVGKRPYNPKIIKQWKQNPGSIDLEGIDTKTQSIIKRVLTLKKRKARANGARIRNYWNSPIAIKEDKRGNTFGYNVINGRRVSNDILKTLRVRIRRKV